MWGWFQCPLKWRLGHVPPFPPSYVTVREYSFGQLWCELVICVAAHLKGDFTGEVKFAFFIWFEVFELNFFSALNWHLNYHVKSLESYLIGYYLEWKLILFLIPFHRLKEYNQKKCILNLFVNNYLQRVLQHCIDINNTFVSFTNIFNL